MRPRGLRLKTSCFEALRFVEEVLREDFWQERRTRLKVLSSCSRPCCLKGTAKGGLFDGLS